MRDRRPVDELSIEELERILAIRRREQRMQRLERMRQTGRVVDASPVEPPATAKTNGGGETVAAQPAQVEPAVPQPPASDDQREQRRPKGAPLVSYPPPKPKTETPVESAPRFEDDPFAEPRHMDPAAAAKRRAWFNRFLLFVEVAAVVGLVYIGVTMVLSINALERETAAAQEQANQFRTSGLPTPEPTSILSVRIDDYVLPGGHVVAADNSASFNFDEFLDDVPSHLQVAVQQQALAINIRRPPVTPETALYVSIPRLNLDQSIVQGTDWEALKQGVGQVQNGAYPAATTGNVVLAAHNDIYGELFKDLDQMQIGDEFQVQTRTRTYTYRVYATDVVKPTDVYVMDDQGRSTVTLISCYPYRDNSKRYVVFAERVDGPGA